MGQAQLSTLQTRRTFVARCVLLSFAASLPACGGGGGDAGARSAQSLASTTMLRALPQGEPGLIAQPAQVADVIDSGQVLAVGRLPNGGYAVVWQTVDDASGTAWSLWVQAYGADGEKAGDKRLLLGSTAAPEITSKSVLVRRDGTIAIAYVVEHNADPDGQQRIDEVRTRLFALDDTPLGGEHVVVSVVAQRLGSGPYYSTTLSQTQMAQWDDGRYLVAWAMFPDVPHGGDHPDFRVRRVDASGEPAGEVVDVGGQFAGTLRLTTLADGSWLSETSVPVTPSAQQVFASIVQFDARHPLELPERRTLPWQSFVLGLSQGGAVLFAGQFGEGSVVVTPYSEWYNPAGKAAGPPTPLSGIPDSAIALDDDTYVAFYGALAQRFDKHGRALGTSFPVEAIHIGDALERQGMVLAWLQGNSVMTQRFVTP